MRHAILKLAYCGPDRAVTTSDIRRAMASKDVRKLDDLEDKISQAHRLLKGVDMSVAMPLLHMLHRDIAAIFLNKSSKEVRRFETAAEAAHALMQAINEKGYSLASPWAPNQPDSQASSTAATSTSSPSKKQELQA